MKIGIFVIKFLFVGALFILATHDLHLSVEQDRESFLSLFYGWLDKLYQQSLNIAGYVVKSEWLPKELNQNP